VNVIDFIHYVPP